MSVCKVQHKHTAQAKGNGKMLRGGRKVMRREVACIASHSRLSSPFAMLSTSKSFHAFLISTRGPGAKKGIPEACNQCCSLGNDPG